MRSPQLAPHLGTECAITRFRAAILCVVHAPGGFERTSSGDPLPRPAGQIIMSRKDYIRGKKQSTFSKWDSSSRVESTLLARFYWLRVNKLDGCRKQNFSVNMHV
eukprot:5590693-Pleurochrysis_carterae.AAC.5